MQKKRHNESIAAAVVMKQGEQDVEPDIDCSEYNGSNLQQVETIENHEESRVSLKAYMRYAKGI